MQVFKAFFKVINKHKIEMLIYILVGLAVGIFITVFGGNAPSTEFSATKIKIAFVNNDVESPINDALEKFLQENTRIIDLDDEEAIKDALFYRDIEYVLTVPEGFSDSLLNGGDVKLEYTSAPDSAAGVLVTNLVNKFADTVRLYSASLDISPEEIAEYTLDDLANETKVTKQDFTKTIDADVKHVYYFNYIAFSIFSALILSVCSGMIVFKNTEIKRRNYCSPVRFTSINLQLAAGNLVFALIVWLIMVVPAFIMYPNSMFSPTGALYLLNSLVFTAASLCIGMTIANVVTSRGAVSAATNVVALGSSFISGVFFPQQFIGKSVLNFAKITPSYWYVRANHLLSKIPDMSANSLSDIWKCIGIMAVFAVGFLLVSLIIARMKRQNS